ncbi:MAG: class II aldolase/adducin family protein [Chloroflexi bacterium]|nr:class II aldolase/adducin family protein [Chloroflexota bacterium]
MSTNQEAASEPRASTGALREQLALACRMLANEGLFDQSGHISARHPERPDWLLIHPHTLARYEVTPESLLTVDLDGHVIEGDDRPPSEVFIHTQLYRARPDVMSVSHIHARMVVVFTIAGRPLFPITNYAAFLGPGAVPVYPNPRHVRTAGSGDALAAALGTGSACLMRAHGAVVVGADVRQAFAGSIYLEENAARAHLALQIGDPAGYTDEELRDVAAGNWGRGLDKTWQYYATRARRAGLG